jgi:hypothetical protein
MQLQYIVVGAIVLLAAAALIWKFCRKVRGQDGCDCSADKASSCPARKPCAIEKQKKGLV